MLLSVRAAESVLKGDGASRSPRMNRTTRDHGITTTMGDPEQTGLCTARKGIRMCQLRQIKTALKPSQVKT